jgi:phosphoribosylformylglycinamidine synthase PurS subunit
MKFDALVTIRLKKGILDPEGLNTKKVLDLLGFSSVSDVKTSKLFKITLDAQNIHDAKAEIDSMCMKLLSNPVIHDYTVNFE